MIVEGMAITRARAAEMLGVSERAVYRYIRRGLLRRAPVAKGTGVLEEDVHTLARARAEHLATGGELAVNSATLEMIMARLQALEGRVAIVFRLLNLDPTPLVLTDPEALAMYQTAVELAENGWSPYVEEQWAQTFVRMRLDNLEQFERVADDAHPWRVFHRLCATMLLVPFSQQLRHELSLGKANLFALVGIWCQLKGLGPRESDVLLSRDGDPSRRTIKRASRGRDCGIDSPSPD